MPRRNSISVANATFTPIPEMYSAGDDPLGVAGFLAVVRRHLEADPGPEGEEQADADRAGHQLAIRREALERVHGVERGSGHVPAGEQADVEDEEHDDLADHPDPHHH